MSLDLDAINRDLGNDPQELVNWAAGLKRKAICTTNFRPFEAVILHMCAQAQPDMPIVWMDSGYATPATYAFADAVVQQLKLNLVVYHPLRSRAHREAIDGGTPAIDDPRHAAFTKEVKLEPFERALREMQPQVWFTAIRAEDTAVRAAMQPVSV
ncbi:MAG: phosphoadenosine phosphosulfate reductase family protein, partial [Stenotrophobium sp.]